MRHHLGGRAGAQHVGVIDVDSTICEVAGKHKQGAGYGYTHALGYHPLLATIAGTGEILHGRLRKGSANTQRGTRRFVNELVARARRDDRHRELTVRFDSGFWNNDTIANLKAAMGGEDYEVENMYPQFAKEAEEEGEMEAANAFKQIAKIEAHHRDRYRKLLELVQSGNAFKREQSIKWKCSKCGYIHEGTEPPETCPACKHPKAYYEPANLDF